MRGRQGECGEKPCMEIEAVCMCALVGQGTDGLPFALVSEQTEAKDGQRAGFAAVVRLCTRASFATTSHAFIRLRGRS